MIQKLKVSWQGYQVLNEYSHVLTQADYVTRYASKDAADEAGAESDEDEDMSSVGSFGDDDDDEPAGPMEEV